MVLNTPSGRPRGVELLQQVRADARARGDLENLTLAGETLLYMLPQGEAKSQLRQQVLADAQEAGLRDHGGTSRGVRCNVWHQWTDELFTQGRYAEAQEKGDEALRCFEGTDDLGRTGRVLVSLGRIERAHGQLDRALANYRRALALQERGKDEPAAVQSLNAIAVTVEMMGRHDEAMSYYLQALSRAKALPSPRYFNALTGNVGGAYVHNGQFAKAAPLLTESLANEREPMMRATRTRQLAIAEWGLGKRTEGMATIDEAVRLSTTLGPEVQLQTLWTRADMYRLAGNLDKAARDLDEAVAIVDQLRAHTIPSDFMKRGFGERHQQIFGATIDLQIARRDGAAALMVSEQARSRAFLDRLAARDAARDTSASSAGTTTFAATRSAATSSAAADTVGATKPTPADATRQSSSSPSSSSAAAVPRAATAAPASVSDIQALAKQLGSTWLIFWVGETQTTVWVVGEDGEVRWKALPIRAARLETLITQSVPPTRGLDGLASAAMASRAHLRPWRELYRALIEPVQEYLPKKPGSRLTIVPHGPLFRLSFAALPDPQGRYLLERYDLHYVPAAGVLQFTSAAHPELPAPTSTGTDQPAPSPASPSGATGTPSRLRNARAASPMRSVGRALLVSDPDPAQTTVVVAGRTDATVVPRKTTSAGARATTGSDATVGKAGPQARESAAASLPPLTYARREIASIAKLLPGPSDTLLGADATEAAVRQQLAAHRVIHFATHGVVHNDPSLDSYLAIRRAGSEASVDGHLTASEIDALTLDADLVVLSACGTALGPISGDGVQGFTRAFLAAGAGSVVATAWSVADRTSYPVMTGFYRAWLAGRSKSRALREAQLAVLRQLRAGQVSIDGVTLHESPWLWAGFVLVGNP